MKKTTANTKYLNDLKNTFIDKAFFIEKLPENINTILDYGCADGSFLMFLKKIYGEKYRYIGIEPNADFYRIAKANKLEVYENFNNFNYHYVSKDLYSNICINFSSSLHEIYNGSEYNFVNEIMDVYKFGAISVRDMNIQIMDVDKFEHKYCNDVNVFIINMMNIFIRKTSQKLSQFITIKPIENLEDIVHFLLKYFYNGSDWIRELNENYLCTKDRFQNTLDLYDELGYELVWGNDYNLPYLIAKWKKDNMIFDLDGDYPWFTTHSQYLFVKKENS